jgi:hypothetical protein
MTKASYLYEALQQYNGQACPSHGIPSVPLVKRKSPDITVRPVVYVDRELEPLELPFGNYVELKYQGDKQKRTRQSRYFLRCYFLVMLAVILFAVWHLFGLSKKEIDIESDDEKTNQTTDDLLLKKFKLLDMHST